MDKYSFSLKFALGAILFLILSLLLIYTGNQTGGFNSVAFTILGIPVHWYGLTMGTAILTGTFIVMGANKSYFHIDEELLSKYLITVIIAGIIGARLLFVILKWPDYQNNLVEIIYLSHGGLSIHGALLGGAVGLWLAAKSDFTRIANLLVLGLPLAQAIGRLGNFFNQEAFGGATMLPWKMFIQPQNRPDGLEAITYFHPTFLYEGLLSVLIFYVLWKLVQAGKTNNLMWTYLILYSGVRFLIEFFRIDSDQLFFLTIAQWASVLIILVGYLFIKKPWISKQ